ncbi:S8 family serine peptidase [Antribacter sp. KLBMP9083]|uniref:S8 family serine peptidase n=1 Tax=Antribacter soli TaxID=2910976 RepID=A0AA41QGN7_9MICO|nr:S8 family serine peptidase [Antribacter soli]MCF4122783.1 S8 family serine peptidase [Antribacter soli]
MSEPKPEPVLRVRDHEGGWRPVRELDPARAQRRRGGRVAPTRYVADRLIVRGIPGADQDVVIEAAIAAAQRRGLSYVLQEAPARGEASRTAVSLVVEGDEVDAWDLLDEAVTGVDDENRVRAGLDHVLSGHRNTVGFARPGGARPAHRPGPPPHRVHASGATSHVTAEGLQRPVVAIVDTGIGRHPWFDEGDTVIRDATIDGSPLGTYPAEEPDGDAVPERTAEGAIIPSHAGHGTFIAGIVHQVCPDAALLPVRVLGQDGLVTEWDLARSLGRLLEYHVRGVSGVEEHSGVDVVILACGFVPESVEDDDYEGVLRGVLRDLRREGVLVVVSAGNDGTRAPVFPAAWAPEVVSDGDRVAPANPTDLTDDYPPLLVVGAANPNGTLADFSNDGPWVTTSRPGVEVLSTLPVTYDGPAVPETRRVDGEQESLDADDFTGGFALWSGTSFAAPVLAGELARTLFDRRLAAGDGDPDDRSSRVSTAWDAIYSVEGLYVAEPTT